MHFAISCISSSNVQSVGVDPPMVNDFVDGSVWCNSIQHISFSWHFVHPVDFAWCMISVYLAIRFFRQFPQYTSHFVISADILSIDHDLIIVSYMHLILGSFDFMSL